MTTKIDRFFLILTFIEKPLQYKTAILQSQNKRRNKHHQNPKKNHHKTHKIDRKLSGQNCNCGMANKNPRSAIEMALSTCGMALVAEYIIYIF